MVWTRRQVITRLRPRRHSASTPRRPADQLDTSPLWFWDDEPPTTPRTDTRTLPIIIDQDGGPLPAGGAGTPRPTAPNLAAWRPARCGRRRRIGLPAVLRPRRRVAAAHPHRTHPRCVNDQPVSRGPSRWRPRRRVPARHRDHRGGRVGLGVRVRSPRRPEDRRAPRPPRTRWCATRPRAPRSTHATVNTPPGTVGPLPPPPNRSPLRGERGWAGVNPPAAERPRVVHTACTLWIIGLIVGLIGQYLLSPLTDLTAARARVLASNTSGLTRQQIDTAQLSPSASSVPWRSPSSSPWWTDWC